MHLYLPRPVSHDPGFRDPNQETSPEAALLTKPHLISNFALLCFFWFKIQSRTLVVFHFLQSVTVPVLFLVFRDLDSFEVFLYFVRCPLIWALSDAFSRLNRTYAFGARMSQRWLCALLSPSYPGTSGGS